MEMWQRIKDGVVGIGKSLFYFISCCFEAVCLIFRDWHITVNIRSHFCYHTCTLSATFI